MGARNVKARMITLQEVKALGCSNISETCQEWLSPSSGGYWTMSAYSPNSTHAWCVHAGSKSVGYCVGNNSIDRSIRAVVVISK